MAKKKAVAKKEVERLELANITVITYDDGSVEVINKLEAKDAEKLKSFLGADEEDGEEEDGEDEDEDEDEEEDEEDEESDEDEDDEDEDDEDEDEEDEEEEDEDEDEEVSQEDLAEADFEELEDIIDDHDLDIDTDDYDEGAIEKLRKEVAKALGIKLPTKKETSKKKKK